MLTITYETKLPRTVHKDEVSCLSKVGGDVYIALKSGYGFHVKESLKHVEKIMKNYGNNQLTGVERVGA